VIIGGFSKFGTPTTTPGGAQKNFMCSSRVELARIEYIKDGTTVVGQVVKATVRKNKTAPPLKTAQFDFYFDDCVDKKGMEHPAGTIDNLKEIVDIGMAMGVFEKHGAWLHYEGQQWNGRDKTVEALHADLELQAKVANEVLSAVRTAPGRYMVKDVDDDFGED
jgi:recombination protein RecA